MPHPGGRPSRPAGPGLVASAITARLVSQTLVEASQASGIPASLLSRLRRGTYPGLLSMLNVRRLAAWLGWPVLDTLRACDAGVSPAQLLRSVLRGE